MSRAAVLPSPVWGLILAAGSGSRFGRPKQFEPVAGHPLLWYSMRAFDRCPDIMSWTVVTIPKRISFITRQVANARFRKLRAIVAGGRTRADSVHNGLASLPEQGMVVIHDAARPLVTPAMLSAGIKLCRRLPVTYATPVTDTLKRVGSNRVIETVDRDGLWAVQTPQFFPLSVLRKAYRSAGDAAGTATDDCGLVERIGVLPRVIIPPGPNIKVTWPADLALVRRLL